MKTFKRFVNEAKAPGNYAAMMAKKRKKAGKSEFSSFSDKQIKQAYGVLNDPRYKGGDLTHAVRAIEKIAKGLSDHPGVQRAMKATSESVEEGKWNYPKDHTSKTNKDDDSYLGGSISDKKKKDRKAWRKKVKAQRHKELMNPREEANPTNTGDVPGTGTTPDDVADWKSKTRKKKLVTRHYIEINGSRKRLVK